MTDPKAKGKGVRDQCVEKVIDKATEMFLEPVLKYIGEFCSEFEGYLANYDVHVSDLKGGAGALRAEWESLHERVEREQWCAINMKESQKVKEWYGEAEDAIREADRLAAKGNREDGRLCLWLGKWCVGRLCYGKSVVTCCKRLKKLEEKGKNMPKEDLLVQGAPDSHDRLRNFEDKFRDLGRAITNLEELQKIVRSSLEDAKDKKTTIAKHYLISSWLKNVTRDINDGKSYTEKEKVYIQDFQPGPPSSEVQQKVERCIKRIVDSQNEGENYLDNLCHAVGSGASCSNEAPPQAQPQPQPQLA